MSTTLLYIIGAIVVCWLIVLSIKSIRNECLDLICGIFSDYKEMYKERQPAIERFDKKSYPSFLYTFLCNRRKFRISDQDTRS